MRRAGFALLVVLLAASGCGSASGGHPPGAVAPSSTAAHPAPSPSTSHPTPTASSPAPSASAGPTSPSATASSHARTGALRRGAAVVVVAVATVWSSPSAPRTVDAPALAAPARIRSWLASMTLGQRRDLSGRVETQVLLGEPVRVLAISGTWARVVVPDQPTPRDARGYPGWIPARQLANAVVGSPVATVRSATVWLTDAAGHRVLEVSVGSRLHVIAAGGSRWTVSLPGGRRAYVASSAVTTAALPATPSAVLATARQFLGLRYLWGGTSGFGFDCSGLVHVVLRLHGVTVPRDADAQARHGAAVRRAALRPGDLVFFARDGIVHHVGMYVGGGVMLHAPGTGLGVRVESLSLAPYAREYAGARRVLG